MTPPLALVFWVLVLLPFVMIPVAARMARSIREESNARRAAVKQPPPLIPWRGNDLEWFQVNADAQRAAGFEVTAEEWEQSLIELMEEEAYVASLRIPSPAGVC